MSWCTIESDPGVFNEMLTSLEVKGVGVEEIYSLDDQIEQQRDAFGLVFLFKWVKESDNRPVLVDGEVPGLIFAKQVVQNACATQAILSVLLNLPPSANVDLGSEISDFKDFMAVLDSESRGFAIGNSDHIRVVHNSFARPEPFLSEETKAANAEKEDAYHFITYLPYEGRIYELDGLKEGPILIGQYDDVRDWVSAVRPAVNERMNRYAATETSFALLSIRPNRLEQLEKQLLTCSEEVRMTIEESIAEERDILQRQRTENVRRRHNYVPLAMALLQALAKKGLLQGLVDKAKVRQQQSNAGKA